MTLVKSFSKTKKSSANAITANAITAIAIDADKSSQYAVKWAVDNLLNESSQYVLLHVRNHSSNPQELEASSIGGRPATNDELQKLFLPYRGLFARKRILAREVVLQDIDVSSALIYYVKNNSVGNIVAGGSSRNLLTRKFRNLDLPSSLLKSAPESCAVYIISSKGKIQSSRPAASQPQMLSGDALIPKQPPLGERPSVIQPDSPRSVEIGRSDYSCDSSISKVTDRNYSSSDNSQKANNGKSESTFPIVSSILPADSHMQNSFNSESESDISDFSVPVSYQSTEISENIDFSSLSKSSKDHFPQSPKGLEAEIKRLRLELKQSMEIYNSVSKEAVSTSQTAVKLQQRKKEEALKLEEARLAEEAALALVKSERQKTRAAMEAALMAQRLVELEAMKREIAELKAMQEEEEKKIVMEAMAYKNVRYTKYTIEEIEAATDYFSISRKIGEGGYGPVYKAQLDHTSVAIKVLGPDVSQGPRQFKQEVEILGSMRHPNMVILLGACPEYGCLVYEYMENGSLEDRLFQKDNSPPIHWSIRFKIAAEIATALLFLHQNKPEPLVHRDLKPANILLDQNYVSKISDVGLARLVPPSAADTITQYHMTTAAGTFCYIDPEYQQTGMLGVKSDLYSLGVVLLQLITARPAMGLSHQVEQAIQNGTFSELLDPTVTGWPVEAALSIAELALQCCELRKRDRPDLASVVLPELIRLRDLGFENAENKNDNIVVTPGPYNSVSEMKQVGGASKPFSNEDRMSQGRGKHPHHISHGSGSKHFKDKPTSNFVYRPKKTSPDVISNSLEAEGSNMKHPECFEAPDSLYRNYDLLSSSTQSDSKNMHPDVGASKPLAHDCFRTKDRTSQGRGKCSHHTFPGADGSSMKQPECIVASDSKTQLPDVSPNSLEAGVSCMKQPECIVVSDLVSGDVIHSFSGHSDSKNMHLDEIGIQIGETPEKKEEDDATSKLNFSGKLKVGHMQESVPPAIADTKDQVSLEEGPNYFLSIGVSEHSVQQAIDKSFDLCPPKKGTVMLNPSLLVTNRQKRNDLKLSIEGQSQTTLKPGMVLLKKYLSISDQVKIVKICRDLGLGPGGFYQPGYRDGANLYLKMMCLGKNWDPETSRYGNIRPTDDAVPPIIPAEFHQLVGKAIQDSRALIEKISMGRKDIEAELPCMSPDICIANFYSATGKLGLHQDKDESQESIDKGLPVVSFSIGDSAEFLYGDLRDVANAKKVILESGDVLIFGGKSRRIFHGVEKIVPDTAPKSLLEETSMRRGRLNLTFRQY